jgi:hypothetical protein
MSQSTVGFTSTTSSSSTTSSTTSGLKNHRCYDLCEHWRKSTSFSYAECMKGHYTGNDLFCADFLMKEEFRILNRGW